MTNEEIRFKRKELTDYYNKRLPPTHVTTEIFKHLYTYCKLEEERIYTAAKIREFFGEDIYVKVNKILRKNIKSIKDLQYLVEILNETLEEFYNVYDALDVVEQTKYIARCTNMRFGELNAITGKPNKTKHSLQTSNVSKTPNITRKMIYEDVLDLVKIHSKKTLDYRRKIYKSNQKKKREALAKQKRLERQKLISMIKAD